MSMLPARPDERVAERTGGCAPASDTAAPPHRGLQHWLRVGLVGYAMIGSFVFVLLMLGNCTSSETMEEQMSEQRELTTGQEVQNVVSFPFRVAGGAVVYPLKFMFVDLPGEIGSAFEDEMAAVRKQLESDSPGDREAAIDQLKRSRSPKAVPLLVRVMHEEEANLRRDAVIALKTLGRDTVARGEPLVPRELERAGREDLLDPQASVESMLIRRMQRDRSAVVRASCALALGELGSERTALPALRRAYEREFDEGNGDAFVPSYILLARAQLGERDIEEEAVQHLAQAEHPVHYGNALLTLAHSGGERAEQELRRALAHPRERIVIAAVTGYGIAGEFGTLLSLARDGTPVQREHALVSLGTYGGESYIGVLEQYRTHEDPRLQRAAIFGMAAAGYPRVVPHLISMLQSVSVVTRLQALTFLVELTGHDLGPEPQPWRDWWNKHGKRFVETVHRDRAQPRQE